MKKLAIIATVTVLVLLLSSCGGPTTPEEIAYAKWQQEQRQVQADKDRAFELEKAKIQAEIEKAKPAEVKLQEEKNKETTFGEGLENAAGIVTAGVVGLTILNAITR